MKRFFKEYLSFSKQEFNGIIFLLALIFIVLITPYIYSYFNNSKSVEEYDEFNEKVEGFYSDYLTQKPDYFTNRRYKKSQKEKLNIKLFDFDPNTATKKDFLALGLSERQIEILFNYRNSGAKFYKPTDLKNVYGISKKQYSKLKPYIKIRAEQKLAEGKKNSKKEPDINKIENVKVFEVDINTADTAELKKLQGIGKVLALRIVKYRDFIGGFYSVKQLAEVYGIKPQVVNKIAEHIKIDSSLIKKIDINSVDFKSLNKHPYLSYAQTKSIFKYRKLMGKFTKPEQLIQNNLLDSTTYFKLKPYITIK